MLADCFRETVHTPSCELGLIDLLVQERIVLILSLSAIAILEESQGVLDDVLRAVESDLCDQLLKEGLNLCLEVLEQMFTILLHRFSVEIDYN